MPGLRAARAARFLTQQELADRAGMNTSTISELEVGHRKARFRTIRQLAAALAVAPEDLVTPPQRTDQAQATANGMPGDRVE